MCIFSQPVISVGATRIFACATTDGKQRLVYQMQYDSPYENAMILPLPVRTPASDASLRFIDLQGYGAFFDDLELGFPWEMQRGIGCASPPTNSAAGNLQVFQVGNYVASFVPRLADFARLDPQFTLPAATWDEIPGYRDFGFAVFQLAAGTIEPHPIAFEFETATTDSLYFPTRHIHDGEVHDREEFDHVLYLQHAGFDSRVYGYQNSDVPDQATGLIRSKYVAGDFCDPAKGSKVIDPDLLVHRRLISGMAPNDDVRIATSGHPTRRSMNLRDWLPLAPWALGAVACAWFFSRRARIRKAAAAEAQVRAQAKASQDDSTPS
ncbi:hypothetical protein [Blastopirellula retiformator]|uniref:DUF2330 domain-containing protein n=1 Tax=Blastopirellula retiformator TaxID=2527970 RepID=A0A5C5V2F8_9BACT|nr:hypothetical protein [Blastopirellula retiformator]TWT31895.1 hypothetical protein Enr8_38200 [Blastopirellula retiformator]